MQSVTIGYIGNFVLNLFVFFLLLAVYSYIEKLENIGCACSIHPNRDFIKGYSIFALVFLIIITLIPPTFVIDQFGNVIASIFTFVKFIFYIICIVFFYLILDYTRYLVNEKCKCSDDMRRELVMAGSIVEIALMLLVLLVVIILPIIFNSITFVIKQVNSVGTYEKELSTAVLNPVKSVKSIPSKVKSASKMFSKFSNKSMKSLRGSKK